MMMSWWNCVYSTRYEFVKHFFSLAWAYNKITKNGMVWLIIIIIIVVVALPCHWCWLALYEQVQWIEKWFPPWISCIYHLFSLF